MRKEIIETGKTVDAAIDSACEKLGCKRDHCEWEIIDLPKKMFLGLKTVPAKVKVWFEAPDQKPVPKKETVREKTVEHQRPVRPTAERVEKPKREKRRESSAEQTEPAKYSKKQEIAQETRVRVTEGFTEKETNALSYMDAILKEFQLTAKLELFREGSGVCIDIIGDGLGTIIGRRGETLDAIQYLVGLVANRTEGDYLRVTVDCGDYRTKRKYTLESLAKKLASQVLKTNTSKVLEPMNPFERRVIHATVSQIEGVSSSSIGEEPNRRVVITSPTARRPAPRGYRDRDKDSDRRRPPFHGRKSERFHEERSGGRPSSRGPRPSATPPPSGPPKETPESSSMSDTPIGKLNLD